VVYILQSVPCVKVNILGFNSRADAESKKKIIYAWIQFATVQE